MTKIEEEIIWNYTKAVGRINKIISKPCCDLEILTDINESTYLTNEQKGIMQQHKDKLTTKYTGCNFDIYVLKSEEKTLCYLICIIDENKIIGLEIDFETKPNVFVLNKDSYLKEQIEEQNISIYSITMIGKNIIGEYKDLISTRTIMYIDSIGMALLAKKIADNLNENMEYKKIKNKYSTMLQEMIIKENEEKVIYYNKIIDRAFEVNILPSKLIAEKFPNEKDYIEFAKRKTIEENPQLTEEQLNGGLNIIGNCFEFLDEDGDSDIKENNINIDMVN